MIRNNITTRNKIDESAVKAAVAAYTEGSTLQEIADSLMDMGYTSPRGGTIYPSEVRQRIIDAGGKTRGLKRSPKSDAVVIEMVRAGAKQVEIGKVINRRQAAVSLIIRRLRAEGRL
jgi:hypothetical protein